MRRPFEWPFDYVKVEIMVHLTRLHPTQPLLRPRPLPWERRGILNPGVTIFHGQILLLYRAIGEDEVSRFGVATSRDGIHFTYKADQPAFVPDPTIPHESHGVEDARITYFDGKYGVVYVATESHNTQWRTHVSLAWTHDFLEFSRAGVLTHAKHDKNAALFPVRWGDEAYLYHRDGRTIGLAKSSDLKQWHEIPAADYQNMLHDPRAWDGERISLASPPLYTPDGWLVFYHGRDQHGTYRIGALLADYAHPERIVAKLPYALLEPELPFEVHGPVPNVVFSCGAVEAGDNYWLYYGGADFSIGGAYINKRDLLDELARYRITNQVIAPPFSKYSGVSH